MENYAQLTMLIVIVVLTGYAVQVCWRLCHQKKSTRQAQSVLKQQRSERYLQHQESIAVLIRCLLQKQVSLTEASIRISSLARILDLSDEERKSYKAFDDLALATSHIPILAEWKRLSTKERYRLTLEREKIELQFEDRIQDAVTAVNKMLNQV